MSKFLKQKNKLNTRYIYFNESFGSREVSSEPIERTPQTPLTPERQAELDQQSTERVQQREHHDRLTQRDREQADIDLEADLAGLEETNTPVETNNVVEQPLLSPEPSLNPQERYELRQEALNDSFVGYHFIPNLSEVSAGRAWERQPSDHWALTGLKSATNLVTSTVSNGLSIVEDVAKFAWGAGEGVVNLITDYEATSGRIKHFFRDGMFDRFKTHMSDSWEDIKTTVDNSAWEGVVGKVLAIGVDTVLGAKGIGRLAQSVRRPRTAVASTEAVAEGATAEAVIASAERAILATQGRELAERLGRDTLGDRPLQPVGTLDEIYELAGRTKPDFDRQLTDIAGEVGATADLPPLKGRTRARQKIDSTEDRLDAGLTDVLRGSLVFNRMEDLYAGFQRLSGRVEIVNVKDRFTNPFSDGYRDILVNIRMDNGLLAEVQFHVKGIKEYTETFGHRVYERNRELYPRIQEFRKRERRGEVLSDSERSEYVRMKREFDENERRQRAEYDRIMSEAE